MVLFTSDDTRHMRRALELARLAEGCTSPNPMVGAVLVKDGRVAGEGFHVKAGQAHAEIMAVQEAGEAARGATLYINLEPCCHFGKTPPCVDALIACGISKAVVAMTDPNPLVAGKGLKRLREAGIEVEAGLLEDEARQLNEAFIKYIQTRHPFVMVKAAMSLDGKIATNSGDSRWISNEKSRAFVHQIRNCTDAVLVGIGTVLKDDPMLNTRLDGIEGKNPQRVILDGSLDIPLSSRIVQTAAEIPTMVFCAASADFRREEQLRLKAVDVFRVQGSAEELDLKEVLDALGACGVTSLLVEGGAAINASFFEAGLVDKVTWFIAPKILGGFNAPSPVGGRGAGSIAGAIILEHMEIRRFDEDICVSGYIKSGGSAAKR